MKQFTSSCFILFSVLILTPRFILAQDLQATTNQALLNVIVMNDKKKPLPGEKIAFLSIKDGKLFSGVTNADGRFSVLIPNGQKYKVQYKAFSTQLDYTELEIPAQERLTFEYTITVTPPKVFTLDNVFFDSGKSTLRSESYKELNELFEYMTLKKSLVVEIAGHTDNVGDDASNQKLSEERAESVKQYLLKKGIKEERVVAKGYGATMPVADNGTASGRQKNRRTEVRILSE